MTVDQKLLIVPYSEKPQTRRLSLSVTKNSEKPLEPSWASLNLGSFSDWKEVCRNAASIKLKNKGEKQSIPFEFTIPARTKTGTYYINPHVAFREGITYQEMHEIAYPHIQTHRFYSRVQTKLQILDLKAAPVKVGYIMGSGDEVPEAIRQMNFNVELLTEADLTSGDLSRFDTIVVGIRAAQVRADFVANNQRIMDFVNNGGTLIVQYQRPDYVQQNLQPYPASMTDTQKTTAGTTARVVDENAKVDDFRRRPILFLIFRIKSRTKILRIGCRSEIFIISSHSTQNTRRCSNRTTRTKRKTKAEWFTPKSAKANIFILLTHFSANFRRAFRARIGFLRIF